MKSSRRISCFLASLALWQVGTGSTQATTLYWDVNGATAGFSTVVGAWNTGTFWNTDSTGGAGGSVTATTTSADDLIIKQASTNSGSITITGAKSASSITFAANVGPTATITGGTSITIGGTGASSGIYEQSTGANTVNTPLILNAANTAFNFSNSATGLLTIGGTITGTNTTGNVTQTITAGSGSSGGITLGGIIANVSGNATKVALTINNTSTGISSLTAANTYTGATTITAGVLQLGAGGTTGKLSASSIITNDGIFSINRSNAVAQGTDFSNASITGSGGLRQNGIGTTTLNISNGYGGATTVNAGTLALGFGGTSSDIISASSPLVMGGGTLQLTGTGTQTLSGLTTTASTGSRILLAANETLTLGALTSVGSNSALNFNTSAGGGNASTPTVGSSVVVLTGQTAGTAINSGYTVSDAGGFGLATVNGSDQVLRLTSTLLLPDSAADSTTDYLVNNNGSGAAAAGSSSLIVTATQSAKSITVDTTAASGILTLNPGVTLSDNIWNIGGVGSNTYEITGGTGLSSVASGNTITINNFNGGKATFTSPILGNGTNPVAVNGTGTTVFAGANTYTGATTINGGSLQISGTGTLGSGGTYAGAITFINAGGVLQYSSGSAQTLSGAITGPAGITKDTGAASTLTLSSASNAFTGNTIISAGTLKIGGAGFLGSSTYAGSVSLSNNATLQYSSTGAQTLSGAITGAGGLTVDSPAGSALITTNTGNNYSGTTTIINGARLSLFSSIALSPNTAFNISGGGQLYMGFSGSGVNSANSYTLSGNGFTEIGISDGAIRFNNNGVLSGPITLAGNTRLGVLQSAATTNTISGKITGGFALEFWGGHQNNSLSQTFVLSNVGAANDYTGNTTITAVDVGGPYTAGSTVLKLGAGNQIPNGTGNGNLVFTGADANHLAVFELNGFSETLNGLSNSAAAGAVIQNTTTGSSTLTIGDADITSTFSGTVTDGGVGKTLAITKTGTGTLTLSGAATYSGNTTINSGTLSLSQANTGNNGSTVTIASSGALMNLNFPGTDTVDKLFIGTTQMAAGTYGAAGSGASTIDDFHFTGSGTLTVVTGPELDHFDISAISSPQTVGTAITGITLTAKNSSGGTVTSFSGTVTFGGSGGFTGSSAGFTAGELTGVSVTPVNTGSNLTFTVTDGVSGKTGTTTITTIQTQYDAWSGGAAFDADANGDGVKNGLAWLLGAANPSASALALLPVASQSSGNLILTFKCLNAAKRGAAVLNVEYSRDLGITDPWAGHQAAVPESSGTVGTVDFVNSVFDANLNNVQATIPASAASPGAKLFGRLNAVQTP